MNNIAVGVAIAGVIIVPTSTKNGITLKLELRKTMAVNGGIVLKIDKELLEIKLYFKF